MRQASALTILVPSFGSRLVIQPNVTRLQIPMHKPSTVCCLQAIAYLPSETDHLGQRERVFTLQAIRQHFALEQRHA